MKGWTWASALNMYLVTISAGYGPLFGEEDQDFVVTPEIEKSGVLLTFARIEKTPTGIGGLDRLTQGGLPRGRTTLIEGGAGSGKTVAALQTLAYGARVMNEPGILVACEESTNRILANAASFDFGVDELDAGSLFLLDARPSPDTAFLGEFDLSGLLAVLGDRVKKMRARRVAFDSLDFILAFMGEGTNVRRELYRLNEWLHDQDLTALLTLKTGEQSGATTDFVQFMVDCVLELEHSVQNGISHRTLRVRKYRGSSFEENPTPMAIGVSGLEVSDVQPTGPFKDASEERVSSGVPALDDMLHGGYLRSSSILLSGAPGTAKTSLAGAFAEAACRRGERTLIVGYDSPASDMVRNLDSIGVGLASFLRDGLLRIHWNHAFQGNADLQLMRIKGMVLEHQAQNLIIDPLSALGRAGLGRSSVERLVAWTRSQGLTLVCTSLLDREVAKFQSTPIEVSTLADTWIHLSYHVTGGEHNRGLSIIKARGTRHSNQVRELLLSSSGIDLTEVYSAGGEVLMGTLRREKEMEQRLAEEAGAVQVESELRQLDSELAALQARLKAKEAERSALQENRERFEARRRRMVLETRSARGGKES